MVRATPHDVALRRRAPGSRRGRGARWSADGQTAWRLRDGKKAKEISLAEARAIAERLGLSPPPRASAAAAEAHAPTTQAHNHAHE